MEPDDTPEPTSRLIPWSDGERAFRYKECQDCFIRLQNLCMADGPENYKNLRAMTLGTLESASTRFNEVWPHLTEPERQLFYQTVTFSSVLQIETVTPEVARYVAMLSRSVLILANEHINACAEERVSVSNRIKGILKKWAK